MVSFTRKVDMNSNSPEVQSIASRHGFSPEAVAAAWDALRRGGGSMAQFNHWELGGGGQWLPGMLMIGDMFNNNLKARVEALFHDLRNQPAPPMPPSQQSRQSQPQGESVSLHYGSAPAHANTWYPSEFGYPSTAGSQNNVRYAYFPGPARLAIELFGKVTIYDTGPHNISGVSQSQSNDAGSMTFTSQFGVIPVATLRVVG
jgi:hypothetical protein